jgi:hypothetical protein
MGSMRSTALFTIVEDRSWRTKSRKWRRECQSIPLIDKMPFISAGEHLRSSPRVIGLSERPLHLKYLCRLQDARALSGSVTVPTGLTGHRRYAFAGIS